jgi:hypothetical protein
MDGGEKEKERESERYPSIYSMGDYPNVGCHLTSPTILQAQYIRAMTAGLSKEHPGNRVYPVLRNLH